jgi:hypothetical protein
MALEEAANQPNNPSPKEIAFISGPLDTGPNRGYFVEHYIPLVNNAIARGDDFVIGPIPTGVDQDALEYLLLASPPLAPERITIFLTTEEERRWSLTFRSRGVRIHVEGSQPRERDAAMTRESTYDILRWRTPDEACELYGAAWRAGYVTNTERNWRRRRGLSEDDVPTPDQVPPSGGIRADCSSHGPLTPDRQTKGSAGRTIDKIFSRLRKK